MDYNLTFMKFCKSEFEDFTSHVSIELEKKIRIIKKLFREIKIF